MGCRQSMAIRVTPGSAHGSSTVLPRSKSVKLKKKETKYTDLEIILYYKHLRELFVTFMSGIGKQNELYLFEAIESLKGVPFEYVHLEFRMWFQNTFMQSFEDIEQLEIKNVSKTLLKSLRAINEQDISTEMVRRLGHIQWEVEQVLNSYVKLFISSETFRDNIYYNPPTLVAPTSNKNPSAIRNKTLLLVTANDLFGKIFSQLLHRELDCDVIVANNGRSAIPLLMSKRLDAVLISPDLPDKGGILVIQEFIRLEDMCKTKIPFYVRPFLVCLMSRDQPAISEGAIRAGFNGILNIPCTITDFENLLPAKSMSAKFNRSVGNFIAAINVSDMGDVFRPLPQQSDDDDYSTSAGRAGGTSNHLAINENTARFD